MYLENIIATLNEFSPAWFTMRAEDERGLVFGRKTDISSIVIRKSMITVQPSLECIDEAVASKANLVISLHTPLNASFFKVREIIFEKNRLLTENNIWVYIMGDSWYHVNQGITDSICQALRLEPLESFMVQNSKGQEIPLGRVITPEKSRSMGEILEAAKQILGQKTIIMVNGDLDSRPKKIMVVGGTVNTINTIIKMLEEGIDMLIAGDLSFEILTVLKDLHIAFISFLHHAADILGMSKLQGLLALKHPNVTFILHEGSAVQYV